MANDTTIPAPAKATPAEVPLQEDAEQEFYTALRAAGASPEQARSCLQTAQPEDGA